MISEVWWRAVSLRHERRDRDDDAPKVLRTAALSLEGCGATQIDQFPASAMSRAGAFTSRLMEAAATTVRFCA